MYTFTEDVASLQAAQAELQDKIDKLKTMQKELETTVKGNLENGWTGNARDTSIVNVRNSATYLKNYIAKLQDILDGISTAADIYKTANADAETKVTTFVGDSGGK